MSLGPCPERELAPPVVANLITSAPTRIDETFSPTAVTIPAKSLPEPRGSDPRVRVERIDADGVPAEWCIPIAEEPARVILYLHGGGYVFGSPDTHREIITRLAIETPARVLAPDYRLAPEHRFPAAHDDCLTTYRWLVSRGVEPSQIVVAGDSAGGALSVGTLLALRDAGEPQPEYVRFKEDLGRSTLKVRAPPELYKVRKDPIVESAPIARNKNARFAEVSVSNIRRRSRRRGKRVDYSKYFD